MESKRKEIGLKESFITEQIVDFVHLYEGKKFAAVFNQDEVYDILAGICKKYKEDSVDIDMLPEKAEEMDEYEKFKWFLRKDKMEKKGEITDETMQEHTNKYAMLSSLFLDPR